MTKTEERATAGPEERPEETDGKEDNRADEDLTLQAFYDRKRKDEVATGESTKKAKKSEEAATRQMEEKDEEETQEAEACGHGRWCTYWYFLAWQCWCSCWNWYLHFGGSQVQ